MGMSQIRNMGWTEQRFLFLPLFYQEQIISTVSILLYLLNKYNTREIQEFQRSWYLTIM